MSPFCFHLYINSGELQDSGLDFIKFLSY